MNGRQETAAPVRRAAARAFLPGVEDDVGRQVLRLAAESVSAPRAEARPSELHRAGVHENLRRRVIKRIRVHRLYNGEVIDHSGEVRKQFGKLRAALAVFRELELRPEQRGIRIDERGAIALEQFGGRQLAVPLRQLRLVVEQLQMARRSGHEKINHPLRLRREMRPLRGERIHAHVRAGAKKFSPAHQRTQRDCPQPDAAILEEPPPRDLLPPLVKKMFLSGHGIILW